MHHKEVEIIGVLRLIDVSRKWPLPATFFSAATDYLLLQRDDAGAPDVQHHRALALHHGCHLPVHRLVYRQVVHTHHLVPGLKTVIELTYNESLRIT